MEERHSTRSPITTKQKPDRMSGKKPALSNPRWPFPKPSPGTVPGSNWWLYQADLSRTGSYPGNVINPPLQVAWETNLQSTDPARNWMRPPVFGHGKVFVSNGLNPGALHAVSTQDGSILWSFTVQMTDGTRIRIRQAPAIANDRVYGAFEVEPDNGPSSCRVYALREADGSVAWQTDVPSAIGGSVALAHARLFVQTYRPMKIFALDQLDGTIVWSTMLSQTDYAFLSPCIAGTHVIAVGENAIFAVDAMTGSVEWTSAFAQPVFGTTPVIYYPETVGGQMSVIAAGIVQTNASPPHDDVVVVHAVSLSGRPLWSFGHYVGYTNNTCHVAITTDRAVVVAGSRLIAFNPANGYFFWSLELPARVEVAPAICNGVFYCVTVDNTLRGVSVATGQEVWSMQLPGNAVSSDAGIGIDQGVMVVPNNGRVIAYAG